MSGWQLGFLVLRIFNCQSLLMNGHSFRVVWPSRLIQRQEDLLALQNLNVIESYSYRVAASIYALLR